MRGNQGARTDNDLPFPLQMLVRDTEHPSTQNNITSSTHPCILTSGVLYELLIERIESILTGIITHKVIIEPLIIWVFSRKRS